MIRFESKVLQSRFNDPRNGFELIEQPAEIRIDPLTGTSTRIAHIGMPPRTHPGVPARVAENAPPVFAPPHVTQITPTYPDDVLAEGRLSRGRCVLFPNLNPYEQFSPVVAVGDRPYVEADQLDGDDVTDALILLREFFSHMSPKVAASGVIGWNFLPAAGSSIPHPHIQAMASGRTPDRQRRERNGERKYHNRTGGEFWTDLVSTEKGGPRWIGSRRNWSAMAAFAPRSVVPETWLVHSQAPNLLEASDKALGGLAEWLCRLAAIHHREGVYAFNAVINPTGPLDGAPSRLRARFLPRLHLVETVESSDLVWVNIGTEEGLASQTPEDWARVVRARIREVGR